ncbi:MAG: hypothetical protein HY645_00890 [Acidobacteria bacterium]|nr:hypothetical protein [Acidobacteriota bacterium]
MGPSFRLARLSWSLPLVILSIASFFLFTGSSREPRRSLADWLIERHLVSDEQAKTTMVTLPGGWKVPLASIPSPALDQALPSGVSAVGITGRSTIFPHFGDGSMGGGLALTTTLFLVNDLATTVNADVQFFATNGSPLTLTLDGVSGSSFKVALKSREMKRLSTSGTGAPKSGWIRVDADQPLTATLSFGIRRSNGTLVTDVGISESIPGTHFTLFADTIGAANTGVAVVNPSESQGVNLHFELLRQNGTVASVTDISLDPRGQRAAFLDEIFKSVSGIGEFEGSVVITSSQPFAGITLRTIGDQLTSLPMVSPAPAGSTRTNFALAQVGIGSAAGLQIKTTILLVNNTSSAATGKVEFFGSDGTPMSVTIGSSTGNSFNFDLAPRAVARMMASGTGSLTAGWARVTMNQPISGAGIFHMLDPQGNILSEAGVEAAPLRTKFRLIADSKENANTGIALVNPDADGSKEKASATVYLYKKTGEFVASTTLTLDPLKHRAQFLTDFFPKVTGIDEFEGVMWIESDNLVAQMSLRQVGEKVTSMPTWSRKYGFAPYSVMNFSQNLVAQSPATEWIIHQESDNYDIQTITLSCPDLGFKSNSFEPGQEIGLGYVPANGNTRAYSLVATKAGAAEFDVLDLTNGGAPFARGKISGSTSSGFQIQVTMLQAKAATYNPAASDLHFFIHSGIINPPASPRTSTLSTDFTSVSANKNYEAPYARKTIHSSSFVAADTSKAALHGLSTLFLSPRATAILYGANLGATPRIIIPVVGGSTVNADVISVASDRVEFFVPPEITRGTIQVDNGSGPGNALAFPVLFAPQMQMTSASKKGESDTTFKLTFTQQAEEYALSSFDLTLFAVTANYVSLATGTNVGKGKIEGPGSADFTVKTDAVAADTMTLGFYQSGASKPTVTMLMQKVNGGVRLTYAPVTKPTGPAVYSEASKLEIELSGIPLKLPAAGKNVVASVLMESGPTRAGGMNTAAQSRLTRSFKAE